MNIMFGRIKTAIDQALGLGVLEPGTAQKLAGKYGFCICELGH